VFRILPSGARLVEFPAGDKARPTLVQTRHLVDGDEVEVSGSKREGYHVNLVRRTRGVVVGTVYANKAGKLKLRLDPRLGVISPAVHVRSVKAGDTAVFTLDAERGYDRCTKLLAGPWPEYSIPHLQMASLVVSLIHNGDRTSGLPDTLDDFVSWRQWNLLGVLRPPAVPQPVKESQPRTDFTTEPTLTIDGPDTQDLDDAISATAEGDGWRVRVHVADVAFEVPKDSELDLWALAQATSVYLPGKTLPMLPPGLSENRCSLQEGKRRRVVTVSFTVTADGVVGDVTVERGVIRSDARLTYDAVDAFLTGDDTAVPSAVTPTVAACAAAASSLGHARRESASLEQLIAPTALELKIADGKISARPASGGTAAHHLIEELMVAANEAVGYWLAQHAAPTLYRRQDDPDARTVLDKIAALWSCWGDTFAVDAEARESAAPELEPSLPLAEPDTVSLATPAASSLGGGSPSEPGIEPDRFRKGDRLDATQVAHLLDIEHDGLRQAATDRVLQALSRAYYAPGPGGHFHLEKTHYLHFTSPIRRYADLVTHRVVLAVLDGEAIPYQAEELAALGVWVTSRAAQADRAEGLVRRAMWASVFADRVALGRPVETAAVLIDCFARSLTVRLPRFSLTAAVAAPTAEGWSLDASGLAVQLDGRELRTGDTTRVRITAVDRLTGRLTATLV
jgi:ribonuclease R